MLIRLKCKERSDRDMESKEHLKQKFAALTDTDVLFLEGKEEMITNFKLVW
jgi:hypothetical protein